MYNLSDMHGRKILTGIDDTGIPTNLGSFSVGLKVFNCVYTSSYIDYIYFDNVLLMIGAPIPKRPLKGTWAPYPQKALKGHLGPMGP